MLHLGPGFALEVFQVLQKIRSPSPPGRNWFFYSNLLVMALPVIAKSIVQVLNYPALLGQCGLLCFALRRKKEETPRWSCASRKRETDRVVAQKSVACGGGGVTRGRVPLSHILSLALT